jgi:SAM-dependent methyltransferase
MSAVMTESFDAVQPTIEWLSVVRCPACDMQSNTAQLLPDSKYVFGNERIAFPNDGIGLCTCAECGLLYKNRLPAPVSLMQIAERQATKKLQPYDFRDETADVQRFTNGESADVLDVGSGNGAFLSALAHRSAGGRRSALDVVQHPDCAEHISGEFIRGLIDSPLLNWSGRPYDIVTLFDVMEHLHAPQVAFRNLRELVRDNGLVVIETGNAASLWPQRHGAHHWWYVRSLDHHLFWSRQSLEQIAARCGFRLLIWREQRHKARGVTPLPTMINQLAQVGLYRIAPTAYPNVAPLLRKHWTQPWSPLARDHFRVVLRKV